MFFFQNETVFKVCPLNTVLNYQYFSKLIIEQKCQFLTKYLRKLF